MPLEKQTAKDKLKQVLRGLFQLAGVSDPDAAADSAVQSLGGTPAAYPDIRLHALKGGTYKIKEYYMENDALQDIRGASALISEVQDHLLPEFLRKKTGFDPILYNGGGNILALVPEETDAQIAAEMELLADRYLITANSAYVLSEPFMLSEFLGSQYHELQSKLEYDLNERKKTKVSFAAAPESKFIGETFLHPSLKLFASMLPGEPEEYCVKCQKRLARYKRNGKTIIPVLTTHTAINYSTHTAEDSKLFTVKAIPKGTLYTAAIDDCGTDLIQKGKVIYAGKYASCGFGKMMIESVTEAAPVTEDDVRAQIEAFQTQLGAKGKATLLLMSDAFPAFPENFGILPQKEYLQIWQDAVFGKDINSVSIEKVFAETQLYSGYNTSRKWGSWRDSAPALMIRKGTSILLTIHDEKQAVTDLTALMHTGFGERTKDGYGAVAVCHPVHRLGGITE